MSTTCRKPQITTKVISCFDQIDDSAGTKTISRRSKSTPTGSLGIFGTMTAKLHEQQNQQHLSQVAQFQVMIRTELGKMQVIPKEPSQERLGANYSFHMPTHASETQSRRKTPPLLG